MGDYNFNYNMPRYKFKNGIMQIDGALDIKPLTRSVGVLDNPDLPSININNPVQPLGAKSSDANLINTTLKTEKTQFGKHVDFSNVNMDQIMSGVNMASGMLDKSENQQFRSGMGSGLMDIGKGIGGKFGGALGAAGAAIGVVNFADSLTNFAFGGGSETDKNNVLGKIPGATLAAGLFGGRSKKFHDNTSAINWIADSGMQSMFQDARNRSGSLFNKGKANRAVEKAEMLQNQLYATKAETEMAQQNQAGQLYMMQNLQNQAGYSPSLLNSTFAKEGTKLPTVEECRRILAAKTK